MPYSEGVYREFICLRCNKLFDSGYWINNNWVQWWQDDKINWSFIFGLIALLLSLFSLFWSLL